MKLLASQSYLRVYIWSDRKAHYDAFSLTQTSTVIETDLPTVANNRHWTCFTKVAVGMPNAIHPSQSSFMICKQQGFCAAMVKCGSHGSHVRWNINSVWEFNAVTRADIFPLHRIDDLLNQLARRSTVIQVYTLGLASGRLGIDRFACTSLETAFITPRFIRLPCHAQPPLHVPFQLHNHFRLQEWT